MMMMTTIKTKNHTQPQMIGKNVLTQQREGEIEQLIEAWRARIIRKKEQNKAERGKKDITDKQKKK